MPEQLAVPTLETIVDRMQAAAERSDSGIGALLWVLPTGKVLIAPPRTPYPFEGSEGSVVPAAWIEIGR